VDQKMNRIYQGRVSKVLDDQNQELDLHALWQHHELFQDAVNRGQNGGTMIRLRWAVTTSGYYDRTQKAVA